MKKYLLIPVVVLFLSAPSLAQVEKNIEQAMKDPKAAENAGKADVLLIDKKKIKDSIAFDKGVTDTTTKKERSCLFKRKKKPAKRSS